LCVSMPASTPTPSSSTPARGWTDARAQRMHLVAVATGAPIRRQPPETSANVTGGHSLEKPLQIATGSKTSSLAGDAREHPAIDDEAPEVHQVSSYVQVLGGSVCPAVGAVDWPQRRSGLGL
jgi:hypothetical protein